MNAKFVAHIVQGLTVTNHQANISFQESKQVRERITNVYRNTTILVCILNNFHKQYLFIES